MIHPTEFSRAAIAAYRDWIGFRDDATTRDVLDFAERNNDTRLLDALDAQTRKVAGLLREVLIGVDEVRFDIDHNENADRRGGMKYAADLIVDDDLERRIRLAIGRAS